MWSASHECGLELRVLEGKLLDLAVRRELETSGVVKLRTIRNE